MTHVGSAGLYQSILVELKKKIFQQTDFTYFCQDLSLFKAPYQLRPWSAVL